VDLWFRLQKRECSGDDCQKCVHPLWDTRALCELSHENLHLDWNIIHGPIAEKVRRRRNSHQSKVHSNTQVVLKLVRGIYSLVPLLWDSLLHSCWGAMGVRVGFVVNNAFGSKLLRGTAPLRLSMDSQTQQQQEYICQARISDNLTIQLPSENQHQYPLMQNPGG
jgi:hypothetical protein